MKATEILLQLGIAKDKGEAIKWVATGSVSINGSKVGLHDNIDTEFINELRVGRGVKLERPSITGTSNNLITS